MFRHALVSLLALSGAGSAHADARQDLHAAFARNVALTSSKATMAKELEKGWQAVLDAHALHRFQQPRHQGSPSGTIGGWASR